MPKRRLPKAIKRFMTLLSANVLGNIVKNAQRVDEFKSHLRDGTPNFYAKYERLADLPAWNSFGEVLSFEQLRGLLDVVTAFDPREGDGLVWYDTYLGLGEKYDVIDDFKRGGLSDLIASDWKDEANRFATGARGQSLSEAIEAAGSLQALTEKLSERLRPIKSGKDPAEALNPELPLNEQSDQFQKDVGRVVKFLRERGDLRGAKVTQIKKAMISDDEGFSGGRMSKAINWVIAHPEAIETRGSSSTSSLPTPADPHRAS